MYKTKKRKLTSVVLAIVVAGALILPAGVWAAVAGDFEIFLTDIDYTEETLEDHAPREIEVVGPEKYIESIEVIHKKDGALAEDEDGTDFVAITNIDIVTSGSDAESIVVDADGAPLRTITPYEVDIENDIKYFQLGIADLANSYDLTIEVYDDVVPGNGDEIETMTFNVPEGSGDIFRISESFSYNTAGGEYTLYDLLDDPGIFTDLLVEHELEDILMSNLETP